VIGIPSRLLRSRSRSVSRSGMRMPEKRSQAGNSTPLPYGTER
jgi:hypothetical protein